MGTALEVKKPLRCMRHAYRASSFQCDDGGMQAFGPRPWRSVGMRGARLPEPTPRGTGKLRAAVLLGGVLATAAFVRGGLLLPAVLRLKESPTGRYGSIAKFSIGVK